MPPGKHPVRLLKQAIANLLGGPTSASNRCKIPQHM
jgi:hypothetical protein